MAQLALPKEEERRLRARARLRQMRMAGDLAYQRHPYPFLRDVVYTVDQAKGAQESGGPRKYPAASMHDPAPACDCQPGGCENYLHDLVNRWWVTPRFLVPKSRRLIVSWTMVALHYWLARYRPGSIIAIASRKQGQHTGEGSAELVNRAWQIHQNLPAEAQPMKVDYTWCRLRFANGSEIHGIAQGADQARQYNYSAYLADEFAFWEQAQKTYAALLPTLEGGGRFTAVSTASPGFMEQLVFDSLGLVVAG